jgi:Zn-dependent peptidase ImmA (M78 family)/transcriptional regulator with XRE-family HTH domain
MGRRASNGPADAEFGLRLRAARKLASLSMDDLVRKMDGAITRQSISKYETGLMKPSAPVMTRLNAALGPFPVREEITGYFDAGRMEFRQKSSLPKKTEEALKRRAVRFFMRFGEIEEVLGNRTRFDNPLRSPDIRTNENIEKAALEVREKWGLGLTPINNLLGLLEFKGVKVYETSEAETGDGFDGLCARAGGVPVMVINRDRPADRIRFTAAHELAHTLCELKGNGEKEKLCHRFAGAFLLPAPSLEGDLVGKRKKVTLWELGAIKRTWGISMQAIMYRALDLGIVSEGCFRDFKATIRRNRWKTNEPVAYEGREEAVRFKRLVHYAAAEGIIGIERGARILGLSEADFRKELR